MKHIREGADAPLQQQLRGRCAAHGRLSSHPAAGRNRPDGDLYTVSANSRIHLFTHRSMSARRGSTISNSALAKAAKGAASLDAASSQSADNRGAKGGRDKQSAQYKDSQSASCHDESVNVNKKQKKGHGSQADTMTPPTPGENDFAESDATGKEEASLAAAGPTDKMATSETTRQDSVAPVAPANVVTPAFQLETVFTLACNDMNSVGYKSWGLVMLACNDINDWFSDVLVLRRTNADESMIQNWTSLWTWIQPYTSIPG